MKKVFSLLLVAGFATIIACGPSAEEKAAAEKAHQDSVNAVLEKARQDSTMMAEKAHQDSINMAMEKMKADSLAAEEAKKAAVKPKPKTKEQKKIEETKKVTHGRG